MRDPEEGWDRLDAASDKSFLRAPSSVPQQHRVGRTPFPSHRKRREQRRQEAREFQLRAAPSSLHLLLRHPPPTSRSQRPAR